MSKVYTLPLTGWPVTKKKTISLSMNIYRNLHFQVSNKLKKMVSEYLLKYEFPNYKKVRVTYLLYFKDKRHRDLMNFTAVADKFILDHLVNRGCLEDDNYNIVSSYRIDYGGKAENNIITFEINEL